MLNVAAPEKTEHHVLRPPIGKGSAPAPPGSQVFVSSPKGTIDPETGIFVIRFREQDGNTVMQIPAEQAVRRYASMLSRFGEVSISKPPSGEDASPQQTSSPKGSAQDPVA